MLSLKRLLETRGLRNDLMKGLQYSKFYPGPFPHLIVLNLIQFSCLKLPSLEHKDRRFKLVLKARNGHLPNNLQNSDFWYAKTLGCMGLTSASSLPTKLATSLKLHLCWVASDFSEDKWPKDDHGFERATISQFLPQGDTPSLCHKCSQVTNGNTFTGRGCKEDGRRGLLSCPIGSALYQQEAEENEKNLPCSSAAVGAICSLHYITFWPWSQDMVKGLQWWQWFWYQYTFFPLNSPNTVNDRICC